MLEWALTYPEWVIGVRVVKTKKLVACVTASPLTMAINANIIKFASVDFLCVHKKLRSRRLTPVLIKEITRRINLKDVWQAVYTGAKQLPGPLLQCRYWHRALDTKKLVEIGFLGRPKDTKLTTMIKMNRLPPPSVYLRPMVVGDCQIVTDILNASQSRWPVHRVWTCDEVAAGLLPRPGVFGSWVNTGPVVTDFASYYVVPSSTANPTHPEFTSAYAYYCVSGALGVGDLLNHLMSVCKCDVFTTLNSMDYDETTLHSLKFKQGTGKLNYYMYNYQAVAETIGLVLL